MKPDSFDSSAASAQKEVSRPTFIQGLNIRRSSMTDLAGSTDRSAAGPMLAAVYFRDTIGRNRRVVLANAEVMMPKDAREQCNKILGNLAQSYERIMEVCRLRARLGQHLGGAGLYVL